MRMFIIAKYAGICVTTSSFSSTNITALDSVCRLGFFKHSISKLDLTFIFRFVAGKVPYSVGFIWETLVFG
jgi:hypothetical protein